MVRIYKHRKDDTWTAETLKRALSDVTNKSMTVYRAAKFHKIPETTLRRYYKATYTENQPLVVKHVGRPTVLTMEEENEIVQTCQLFAEWGFGLTKLEVVNIVTEYCKNSKKPTPFRDGVPGIDWWNGFCKRHPTLVARKPQQFQLLQATAATPDQINNWFVHCLKPELDQLQLHDDPKWIFNVDESGFPLGGKPVKVLAKRGMKSPQSLVGGSGRENITVQTCMCISGDGQLLPPYVVYTGKHLMANTTNDGPFGT